MGPRERTRAEDMTRRRPAVLAGGAALLLAAPADISPAADGALLIADTGNNVIRRVSRGGTITTVAGRERGSATRRPGATPTGARDVDLEQPEGVAALSDGGFLIADSGAN